MSNLNQLATEAANVINGYKTNKVIMDFVTKEAREKVAAEICNELKGGTTAKAVELLEIRHANIRQRVEEYINLGLIGCYIASIQA